VFKSTVPGLQLSCAVALAAVLATVEALPTMAAKPSPSSDSSNVEYLFVQQQAFSGLHKIYWTPSALRIDCITQGYTIVMHAPDYQLYVFRDDDKVYRTSTLKEFFHDYPYNPNKADRYKLRALKLETTKKDGLSIVRYRKKENDGSMHDLYTVESPAVATQVSDMLYAYYRMEPARGIVYRTHWDHAKPLRTQPATESWQNSVINGETSKSDIVRTTEVKKMTYNARDFECPKGYRSARREELYTSRSQKKQAESLIDDLNIGGKLGTKDKGRP